MKKNLKVLLPTLLIVLGAQILLVRTFVKQTNQQMAQDMVVVDSALPQPSARYEPREVVQVILYSLRNNDLPSKDAGTKTFWQFMTQRLRSTLRDKALSRPYLGEDLWKAITDFDSYRFTYSKIEDTQAVFELELISHKRLARQFVVALHKQGDFWLIDQLVKRL